MTFAVLDSTKTLEVLLQTAVTTAATYALVYADHSSTGLVEGSLHGTITNTNNTATTVSAAPAAGTNRMIKSLTVFNNDASASIIVTPRYNVSSNYYPLDKKTIFPGKRYCFSDSMVESTLTEEQAKLFAMIYG